MHNGLAEISAKVEGMSALEWLVRACEGHVGLQVDTGWAAAGGANLKDFLARNEAFVRSIHHKDLASLCENPVNVAIGAGVVDSVSAFEFGRAHGLGQLVDQDTSPTDLIEDMIAGLRYLESLEQTPV